MGKVEKIRDNFRRFGEDFKIEKESEKGFIFSRRDPKSKIVYFEVFEKRKDTNNVNFEFDYPHRDSFGDWAYIHKERARAEERLESFESK